MSSQTSFTFSEVKSCLYPSTLVEILNSLYGGSEGLESGVCSVYAGLKLKWNRVFPSFTGGDLAQRRVVETRMTTELEV